MENIDEIRNLANRLREEFKNSPGVLGDAIECYAKLWAQYSSTDNEWDGWGYAYCLRLAGKLEKALEVSKAVYVSHNEFAFNNNLLATILNDSYFKKMDNNMSSVEITKLLDIVVFMGKIVQQEKSSLEFCTFRILDKIKKLAIFPHDKVLQVLDKLEPLSLKTDAYSITVKDKELEQAPNIEKYYAYKTKALLKAKCYKECIACCNDAKTQISKFHYSNNVWIESRSIQAEAGLGNILGAIAKQEELLLRRDDWFLLRDMGRLYLAASRQSDALVCFFRAAITREPPNKKVGLYELLGDLLLCGGDVIFANKHYQFCRKLRQDNDWAISYKLKNKLIGEENVSLSELKRYWLDSIYKIAGKKLGKITKINVGGKTGFISYDGGSVFYITSNIIVKNKSSVKENDKVEFVLTSSFDKRINKKTKEANYITIISGNF